MKLKRSKGSSAAFIKGIGDGVRSALKDAEFLIGLACDPGTVALPNYESRNSYYTESLLRQLRSLPKKGSSLPDIMTAVTFDVVKCSRRKQRPWYESCLTTRVVLCPVSSSPSVEAESKNWRIPGIKFDRNGNAYRVDPLDDYGALSGKAERECLSILGFSMIFAGGSVGVDNGIRRDGFIDGKLLAHWGVSSYVKGIWGSAGKAVELACQKLAAGSTIEVRKALAQLE